MCMKMPGRKHGARGARPEDGAQSIALRWPGWNRRPAGSFSASRGKPAPFTRVAAFGRKPHFLLRLPWFPSVSLVAFCESRLCSASIRVTCGQVRLPFQVRIRVHWCPFVVGSVSGFRTWFLRSLVVQPRPRPGINPRNPRLNPAKNAPNYAKLHLIAVNNALKFMKPDT